MKKQALLIIVDGVEEVEALTPVDLMRRADIDVTMAAAGGTRTVTGKNGIRIEADALLEETSSEDWDLLVIPGGPGHKALMRDPAILERIRTQSGRGSLIGAICAGPLVLKEAGILEGKRFTSFPATAEALPERDPHAAVVVDGNLITSQGAGTALPFALALVKALKNPEAAAELARSICAPDQLTG